MAGGYNGQLVALDVNTPSEDQLSAAQGSTAQSGAQLAQQTLPADVAYKQAVSSDAQSRATVSGLSASEAVQLDALKQHRLAVQESAMQAQQTQQQLGSSSDSTANTGVPSQNSLFVPALQQALQAVDPNAPNAQANYDATMTTLAQTVPQAKQFIGQPVSSIAGWLKAAGAHAMNTGMTPQLAPQAGSASPLAAAAPTAPASASPLATAGQPAAAGQLTPPAPAAAPTGNTPSVNGVPISPLTGQPDPDLARMAILDPAGTQKQIAMEGMMQYQRTGNTDYLRRYAPDTFKQIAEAQNSLSDAQKTAQFTKTTGLAQSANSILYLMQKDRAAGHDPQKDPTIIGAYQQSVQNAARNGWITPQLAQQELSAPMIDEGQLTYLSMNATTWAEAMKGTGQEAANEAIAKQQHPESNMSYTGTDASGHAILLNTHPAPGANPLTVTSTAISGKPGAGVATFDAKQAAWMAVHPGDAAGALQFAGGKKSLDPAQIAIAARGAALHEQQNAALTGGTVNVDDLTSQFTQEFSQAASVGSAPAGGAPAPAGHTQPQAQAAKDFLSGQPLPGTTIKHDPKAPGGSPTNPWWPKTQADYAKMPSKSVYIGQDGLPHTKP